MRRCDKIFLWTVVFLVLAGLFILASASLGLVNREGSGFLGIVFRQIILGLGVGIPALLITGRINYRKWKTWALPLFIGAFILSALVFEPHIGFRFGGANRWLKIGSFFFQPSELLKFGFIVYLASWINSRKEHIESFKSGLMPFLIFNFLVGIILTLEPDLGTLGVIVITGMFMFLVGGGKFSQIAVLFFIGLAILGILILIKPHAMSRVMVFINPSFDPQGLGYQVRQSMIAVGSGGMWGRGLGKSIQKFNYLPEPVGDSIFAVFAEEFGFIGSIILLSSFLFLLYRGFLIASRAPDFFGKMLAVGLSLIIVTQSLVNISAMIGLIPLTGLPLIFVSQGGSALAVTLAEIGVLLNISKYN